MEKLTPKPKGIAKTHGGKAARIDIDWELAETYYIQGEIVEEKGRKGELTRRKPSYVDVARRFKCASGLVAYHSKKRNWRYKREVWERQAAIVVAEEVSKARALSLAEGAAILDAWLLKFKDLLEKGFVKVDSLSDFNIAIRLKTFIEAQGAMAGDNGAGLTLDDLQRKHKRIRQNSGDISADVAGVLVDESMHVTPNKGDA